MYFSPQTCNYSHCVSILLAGDFFPPLVGPNLNFSILLPTVNAFSNYCILAHINEFCMGEENKAEQVLSWYISAMLNTFQEISLLLCPAWDPCSSAVNTEHNPTIFFVERLAKLVMHERNSPPSC